MPTSTTLATVPSCRPGAAGRFKGSTRALARREEAVCVAANAEAGRWNAAKLASGPPYGSLLGDVVYLTPHFSHHPLTPSSIPQIASPFAYNNESDILYLRLLEYADIVDYFVVVEAPLTFSGVAKPLYFGEQACSERFAPFASKIVHVVLDPSLRSKATEMNGTEKGAWAWERLHRVRRYLLAW